MNGKLAEYQAGDTFSRDPRYLATSRTVHHFASFACHEIFSLVIIPLIHYASGNVYTRAEFFDFVCIGHAAGYGIAEHERKLWI